MLCIDGNNSLKRLATRADRETGDTRTFATDYILPREFVDKFANDVKARQAQPKPAPRFSRDADSDSENDIPPGSAKDETGDPTDEIGRAHV